MTDAPSPETQAAIREIDNAIIRTEREQEHVAQQLADARDEMTRLVHREASLKITADGLRAVRESLAPMPTPEADALEAVEPPLDVACPGCGADYGEPCRMFGAHDVPRGPHLIRRQASDAKAAGERMAANLIKSVAFHA